MRSVQWDQSFRQALKNKWHRVAAKPRLILFHRKRRLDEFLHHKHLVVGAAGRTVARLGEAAWVWPAFNCPVDAFSAELTHLARWGSALQRLLRPQNMATI
jgi:hypothetical protein